MIPPARGAFCAARGRGGGLVPDCGQPHPEGPLQADDIASLESQDWVERARALAPLLAAAAPRIEQACELPADVLDAMHRARLFRMLLPRSLGGGELDLATFFQAASAVAEGDASAAWCLVQTSGCALSSGYLAPQAAREVFGEPRAVLAWGFATGPHCRAVEVEGGWRVSGTWSFGSGSRHATWLGGHCRLVDARGAELQRPDGRPLERTMLFPRAAAAIRGDAWHVIGLRGTGSDSYSVADLHVPASHALVVRAGGRDQEDAPGAGPAEAEPERREPGTLYRFSATHAYESGFAGVALGVARTMLGAFVAMAEKKVPVTSREPLREDPAVQARVGESTARLESARAWLLQALREAWENCARAGYVRFEDRVRLRLAASWAIRQARAVAEDVYADAGASAIFEGQPFERRLRDMHAVSQQVQGSAFHFQNAGRHYLGLAPGLRYL